MTCRQDKQWHWSNNRYLHTLQGSIDSTKEIRGNALFKVSNCSHINETVGFYQPFHDHIAHGLPIHLFLHLGNDAVCIFYNLKCSMATCEWDYTVSESDLE